MDKKISNAAIVLPFYHTGFFIRILGCKNEEVDLDLMQIL